MIGGERRKQNLAKKRIIRRQSIGRLLMMETRNEIKINEKVNLANCTHTNTLENEYKNSQH